jgi:O-antigen ligase
MFVAVMHLRPRQRVNLLWIVVLFAIGGAMLGALQLASGDGAGVTPYRSLHTGFAVGLFTNRNHQACFLLVAMVLTAGASAARTSSLPAAKSGLQNRLFNVGLILLLGLGVVTTTSRMGTALLPVVLIAALLILFHDRLTRRLISGVALGLIACAAVALQSGVVNRTVERFGNYQDDARFTYWRNVEWALGQYRWSGTGFGSFLPIYEASESLDSVEPTVPRNAHNDYLEIALEGGAPALVLLTLFLLFVVRSTWLLRRPDVSVSERVLGLASLTAISIVLLCSIVDYPLRRLAIETVFAAAAGLLVPAARQWDRVSHAGTRPASARSYRSVVRLSRAGVCTLIACLLAWQVLAVGGARHFLAASRPGSASNFDPWSSRALSRLADAHLVAERGGEAAETARAALAISPIDAAAVRSLAWAEETRGENSRGMALLAAAGNLGWRDTLTQLWLIDASLALDEPVVVLQRADALLRRGIQRDQMLSLLARMAQTPGMDVALSQQLAQNPSWRTDYMLRAWELPREHFSTHEALLLRLAASEAPPRVVETRGFIKKLADNHEYQRAHRLWLKVGGVGPVHNPEFETETAMRSADVSPFEWRSPSVPGVKVSIAEPDVPFHGKALRIQSEGIATGTILTQTLVLPPGDHILSVAIAREGRDATGPLGLSIGCGATSTGQEIKLTPSTGSSSTWTRFSGRFSIPKNQCAVQQFNLILWQAAGTSIEAWLDQISIGSLTAESPKRQ